MPEKVEAPKEEKVKKQQPVVLVQDMGLPALMAWVTEMILSALQDGDQTKKQQAIAQARADFRLWYESQPVEGRGEQAKASKKLLESFKMISEQFYQDIVTLAAQDL